MKKIILLILIISFSCSDNENSQEQNNIDRELNQVTKQLISLSNQTFFINPQINRTTGKLKNSVSATVSFFEQKKILLEVHLFNFSGNLYNKYLTVEFLKFIRKEKKFKNVDQLKKQIKTDLLIAKKTK